MCESLFVEELIDKRVYTLFVVIQYIWWLHGLNVSICDYKIYIVKWFDYPVVCQYYFEMFVTAR